MVSRKKDIESADFQVKSTIRALILAKGNFRRYKLRAGAALCNIKENYPEKFLEVSQRTGIKRTNKLVKAYLIDARKRQGQRISQLLLFEERH